MKLLRGSMKWISGAYAIDAWEGAMKFMGGGYEMDGG